MDARRLHPTLSARVMWEEALSRASKGESGDKTYGQEQKEC